MKRTVSDYKGVMEREQQALAEALHDTAIALNSTLELEEVFDHILANIGRVVSYTAASIWLIESGIARPIRVSGQVDRWMDAAEVSKLQFAIEEAPLLQRLKQGGQAVAIVDTQTDPDWEQGPHAAWIRSYVIAPIRADEELVGFLDLVSEKPGFFKPAYAQRLQAFANQAALALRNARLFAEMKQRAERLALVNEISMAINLRVEFEEVLQAAVDGLAQALGVGQTGLALFTEGQQKLVLVADHPAPGVTSGVGLEIPLDGNRSMEVVLATGQPLVIVDAQRDPILTNVHWLMAARRVQSILIAPLLVRNEVIGTIGCDAIDAPRAFNAEDVRLAQTIANLVAARIDLARAVEAERQRRQEIEAVQRASLSLIASLDLPQVLNAILAALLELAAAHSAAIFLYEDAQLSFGLGITERGIRETPHAQPRPQGLTATVARTGKAIFVEDTARHPLYADAPAEWGRFAIAGLPLKIGKEVVGVMNVAFPATHVFADSEMRLLSLLATQAALAIQNARLHGEIQNHAQALEQRVAERTAELEEERRRLQAILDSAGEAIYFTDADKRIRYANPATERITGYSAEELVNRPGSVWRGPTPAAVIEAMEDSLARGQAWQGEVINRRKDGSLYHGSLSISPIQGPSSQILGYVCLQRDITNAKEVARLREEFVSRIGHELRTPLANIQLYLDLLQRGQPEIRPQYAAALRLAAARMQNLIEGFLDFSQLIAHREPAELLPTDLNRLAADSVQAWQGEAQERQLSLGAELDTSLPPAMADPVMVHEIVRRLLANALDYTPAGGRVTVATGKQLMEEGQEWLALKVTDTGPGIPGEEIPRLLEPFYRGKAAADYTVPGAGLGLAICRELAKKLGGDIVVESVVGSGTTFTVYLKAFATSNEDDLAP